MMIVQTLTHLAHAIKAKQITDLGNSVFVLSANLFCLKKCGVTRAARLLRSHKPTAPSQFRKHCFQPFVIYNVAPPFLHLYGERPHCPLAPSSADDDRLSAVLHVVVHYRRENSREHVKVLIGQCLHHERALLKGQRHDASPFLQPHL